VINIELELRQAAAVREALFRSTSQDSYEFPSQRTIEIRKAIVILDEEISKKVSETSKEDS
jgi:hypothetical protein|tara:strand:+ start:42 stop:224 length:183 start_codon:yes stop_codon:yes gene_type:complete